MSAPADTVRRVLDELCDEATLGIDENEGLDAVAATCHEGQTALAALLVDLAAARQDAERLREALPLRTVALLLIAVGADGQLEVDEFIPQSIWDALFADNLAVTIRPLHGDAFSRLTDAGRAALADSAAAPQRKENDDDAGINRTTTAEDDSGAEDQERVPPPSTRRATALHPNASGAPQVPPHADPPVSAATPPETP